MKPFKLLPRLLAGFGLVMMFGVLNASATTLDTDTFDANADGWGGTGSSWYAAGKELLINRDKTGTKTFTFAGYANQVVEVTLSTRKTNTWESNDVIQITANGASVYNSNTDGSITFRTTLNASGQLILSVMPNTNNNDENMYIDNVVINYYANAHAVDDTYTIGNNSTITSNVITNDFGPSIAITAHTAPTHGTVVINSNGSFIYTPLNQVYTGSDTFTYTIQDSGGSTSTAGVNITIAPDYTAPSLRAFAKQRQENLFGDMLIVGNSVKLQSGGVCPGAAVNNNDITAVYADMDTDVSTYNSTSANIVLPVGVDSSKILYAYLYWQGRTANDGDVVNGKTVMIKPYSPVATSYQTISTDESKFNWNSGDYQGFNDITTQIKTSIDTVPLATINATGYNQPLWVANIFAPVNSNGFGAWSVVIVYQDPSPTAKFRSVTLFDGYVHVSSGIVGTAALSGFLTPKTGTVDAKFILFGGEGDISLTTDDTTMTNAAGTAISLGGNVFKSSEDVAGTNVLNRSPSCQNTIGVDIRTFNVGNANGGLSIIGNNQMNTNIRLTSNDDEYYPGVFAFSTELYEPKLCYDYSYKQDGVYLKSDNTGNQLPYLKGTISNSPIDATIYIRNIEADIDASHVSFYTTDVNSSKFAYVNNSIATSNINGSSLITQNDSGTGCDYNDTATTPIGCVNEANVRIGLGKNATGYSINGAGNFSSNEFAYAKFSLLPLNVNGVKEDVNESLGLKLDYTIRPTGVTDDIIYNYTLGSNMSLCPPTAGYAPTWGTFNVVDAAAGSYTSHANSLPYNNLRTQVSRKPFDVNVAAYGKYTDGTYTIRPTADLNTTLVIEMIDNDAFHDANASCANPDSNISAPIFVPLKVTAGAAGTMLNAIPTQSESYYDHAVKNGSFRMWYFDDGNQTLIQNWTAGVSDPLTKLNLTSISGLYKSTVHTACASSCTTATSPTCYSCIKQNYAKALCSRDNFAIRPESYDLRIFDVNQTLAKGNALKESTKIDLSNQYKYAPMYSTPPTDRMKLAAGYAYRYDMNATGHDTSLALVPGYTRYFKGVNSDYSATMLWDPTTAKTGCNDTADRPLTFYVANGQMQNTEDQQEQVGEYKINVIDKTWTESDWNSALLSHHTAANGFDTSTVDCITNNDTTVVASGKIGCTITSAHTNGTQLYKDHLLELKPYKFGVNLIHGIGITAPLNMIGIGQVGFVYDSDLNNSNDMRMAVKSWGPVNALGYTGGTLTNFVDGCYSKDVNVSVRHDANLTLATPFVSRFVKTTRSGAFLSDSYEINGSNQIIKSSDFFPADKGDSNTTLYLNFDRNITTPLLPQKVAYFDINVSCMTLGDCNNSADLSYHDPRGLNDMDFNVTHVYGRLFTRDVHVMGGLVPFTAIADYEVYKSNPFLGRALIANTSDANWSINSWHNNPLRLTDINSSSRDGNAIVTVVIPTGTSFLPDPLMSGYLDGVETYGFPAFTQRGDYRAHIDTEGWLWHNPSVDGLGVPIALQYMDPNVVTNLNCLSHPCFSISFGRISGNTGSADGESTSHKASKKTSTGGGAWHSTSEFAPASR